VSGNQFVGASAFGNAGGILVYNAGQVTVSSNIVSNNDTNIIIDGGQDSSGNPLGGSDFAIVSSNQVFSATVYDGIDLVDGVSKVTVAWNYSFNNATDGIFIDANTGGNTLTNNLVTDNKNYDIEDVTYSPSNYQGSPVYGTFNSYAMDQFGSSNDPSLPSTSYF
jgi:parallel beta-helix repeat protein